MYSVFSVLNILPEVRGMGVGSLDTSAALVVATTIMQGICLGRPMVTWRSKPFHMVSHMGE